MTENKKNENENENIKEKKTTQFTGLLKPSEKQKAVEVSIKKIKIPVLEDLNKFSISIAYDNFLRTYKEQHKEKLQKVLEAKPDFDPDEFELSPIIVGLLQSAFKRTIKKLYKLKFIIDLCESKSITKINKPILNNLSIELFDKGLSNNEITVFLKKYKQLYDPAVRNTEIKLLIDEEYLKEIKSSFYDSTYFDDERIKKICDEAEEEFKKLRKNNPDLNYSNLEFKFK